MPLKDIFLVFPREIDIEVDRENLIEPEMEMPPQNVPDLDIEQLQLLDIDDEPFSLCHIFYLICMDGFIHS